MTAKARIEYVRSRLGGDLGMSGNVIWEVAKAESGGQPLVLAEELEIGTDPVLSAVAPAFAPDVRGATGNIMVRVTALAGAIVVSEPAALPTVNNLKGVRVEEAGGPVLMPIESGRRVALVMAAQQPGGEVPSYAPVTGVFNASARSLAFAAAPGRPINLRLSSPGPWVATVRLLRKLPGEADYSPLTLAGQPWATFTAAANEPVWEESEAGALFVLECAWTSGAINYRISQ
jgi:hypothetical protein